MPPFFFCFSCFFRLSTGTSLLGVEFGGGRPCCGSANSTSEQDDEEGQLPGAALELEVFKIEEDEENSFPGSVGDQDIEEELKSLDEVEI